MSIIKCCKCSGKLDCTEERDYLEAKEFDIAIKPICDECYNMQDSGNEIEEGYSDADSGL